jgi:hypothetical protein
MNGDYLDRRADMWTKIRMENESHLKTSLVNRLFELGLVDPIVAVHLDAWRRSSYASLEHMLLDLVAAQTEQVRKLVDKLTLAKQLEPVSVVIKTDVPSSEQTS